MHYPIARVFDEAAMVVERKNNEMATIGILIQGATATTGLAASKSANDGFKKLIATLSEDSE